jgi:hypothetical protein
MYVFSDARYYMQPTPPRVKRRRKVTIEGFIGIGCMLFWLVAIPYLAYVDEDVRDMVIILGVPVGMLCGVWLILVILRFCHATILTVLPKYRELRGRYW